MADRHQYCPNISGRVPFKAGQFGADQISPLPDLSVTVALKTETALLHNPEATPSGLGRLG